MKLEGGHWFGCMSLGLTLGCGSVAADRTQPNSESTEQTSESRGDDGTTSAGGATTNKVDILLIVDNSGGMGDEQGRLAESIAALTAMLDNPSNATDYRIAVTSSDNGHADCRNPLGTGGVLQHESCLDRRGDFVNATGVYSRFNTACKSVCNLTTTELNLNQRWVASNAHGTNLPEDVSVPQALACLTPQGISGCEYEAPLESMYRALERMADPDDASHGFMRDDAMLAIIFVTDELDCSYNSENPRAVEIFAPDNDTFWPAGGDRPTSAICWRASTSCKGDLGGYYEDCPVLDYNIERKRLDPGESDMAVLFSVSRYESLLERISQDKRSRQVEPGVIVSAIAGVDTNGRPRFPRENGPRSEQFGIEATCRARFPLLEETDPQTGELLPADLTAETAATPSIRLSQLAGTFGQVEDAADAMYSVCESNYGPALAAIGERIVEQLASPQ